MSSSNRPAISFYSLVGMLFAFLAVIQSLDYPYLAWPMVPQHPLGANLSLSQFINWPFAILCIALTGYGIECWARGSRRYSPKGLLITFVSLAMLFAIATQKPLFVGERLTLDPFAVCFHAEPYALITILYWFVFWGLFRSIQKVIHQLNKRRILRTAAEHQADEPEPFGLCEFRNPL